MSLLLIILVSSTTVYALMEQMDSSEEISIHLPSILAFEVPFIYFCLEFIRAGTQFDLMQTSNLSPCSIGTYESSLIVWKPANGERPD